MQPSETNFRGEKIRMLTSNFKESTLEPSYYHQNGQDLIDHLSEIFNTDMFIGFMTGNIFKYLTRWQHKNGIEDLEKAQVYLNRLIKFEKQQNQSL